MIEPTIDSIYVVKSTSGNIPAKFLRKWQGRGGIIRDGRKITRYIFENQNTGREIVIRSRVKIRSEVK